MNIEEKITKAIIEWVYDPLVPIVSILLALPIGGVKREACPGEPYSGQEHGCGECSGAPCKDTGTVTRPYTIADAPGLAEKVGELEAICQRFLDYADGKGNYDFSLLDDDKKGHEHTMAFVGLTSAIGKAIAGKGSVDDSQARVHHTREDASGHET